MGQPGRPTFLLAIVGLSSSLVALSFMVSSDGSLTVLDENLNRAMEPVRTPGSLIAAERISALGSPIAAAVIVAFSGLWLWMTRRRTAVFGLAILAVVVPFSFEAVKAIVARPRPEPLAGIVETGLSFPSGTTTIFAALFSYLAYLVGQEHCSAWLRRMLAVAVFFVVATVGLSRMILSVHYLSDVVCGAILGLLCMLVSMAVADKSRKS